MTKAAPRRKTDARASKERRAELTTEQRQAIYLTNLSKQVGEACDRWLREHGVEPEAWGAYDGPAIIKSAGSAQPPACGEAFPCGDP